MKTNAQSELSRVECNEDDIRAYAYHLFEQSGRMPGHDLENWLEAEAYVIANAQKPVTPSAQNSRFLRRQSVLTVASDNPFRATVAPKNRRGLPVA